MTFLQHVGLCSRNLQRKGIVILTIQCSTPAPPYTSPVENSHSCRKPPSEPGSYRTISLLSTISKSFEKQPLAQGMNVIPEHQVGFRAKHSTLKQVHRVSKTIRQALECKKTLPAVFIDVSQAFDKVWTAGLLHKCSRIFSAPYIQLLESYLADR